MFKIHLFFFIYHYVLFSLYHSFKFLLIIYFKIKKTDHKKNLSNKLVSNRNLFKNIITFFVKKRDLIETNFQNNKRFINNTF